MAWFKRKKAGILTDANERKEAPENYWTKCPQCGKISSRRELEEHAKVCPGCGYHFRMNSLEYLHLLFDDGAFTLHDTHLYATDPLEFVDTKPYKQRLKEAQEKTGMNDAVRSATGMLGGIPVSIAIMDFSFIGGSMGSVVGEMISRAIKRATEKQMPLIIISQSGGARMQEGAFSLMQMAKTSAHLTRFAETGLPYISVLTHPTTGGVTASFAMLGDFHLAEPGALIGFAGPRVIRETIGHDLPPGFQRSEFLIEKGFVDRIVPRTELRETLIHLIRLCLDKKLQQAERPLDTSQET